jgi:hypothetical protein
MTTRRINNRTKTRKHRRQHGGVEFTPSIYDCPLRQKGKKAAVSTCAKEFAESNDFFVVKTADDGNCFFDTLSKFGGRSGYPALNKPHLELRYEIVSGLLDNINNVAPFFVTNNENANIANEIQKFGEPNLWDNDVGDIMTQYAATIFKVNISIFDIKNSQPRDVINKYYFTPKNINSNIDVHMLRIHDSHYQLLWPKNAPILSPKSKGKAKAKASVNNLTKSMGKISL